MATLALDHPATTAAGLTTARPVLMLRHVTILFRKCLIEYRRNTWLQNRPFYKNLSCHLGAYLIGSYISSRFTRDNVALVTSVHRSVLQLFLSSFGKTKRSGNIASGYRGRPWICAGEFNNPVVPTPGHGTSNSNFCVSFLPSSLPSYSLPLVPFSFFHISFFFYFDFRFELFLGFELFLFFWHTFFCFFSCHGSHLIRCLVASSGTRRNR